MGSRPTCPALLLTSPPISLPTSTTPPKGGHDTLPPHPPKAPLEEARAGPEGGEREREDIDAGSETLSLSLLGFNSSLVFSHGVWAGRSVWALLFLVIHQSLLHSPADRLAPAVQDKMSRISHKCAVVCLPLCVGQVKQLEATYPNSNQHASGFRLRFHWQHRASSSGHAHALLPPVTVHR